MKALVECLIDWLDKSPSDLMGIPDDRDRSFRRIVTDDSDLS
jgi:hypothetical protein